MRFVWAFTCLSGTVAVIALAAVPAAAQRPAARDARSDSIPLRADYRDIRELLDKLPNVAPPKFDRSDAVALGAIQLACLDRLQPRVPQRPGDRDSPGEADSSAATDSASVADSSSSADSSRTPPSNNRGEGYFWVTSYRLTPSYNQTRAFWGCSDWHSAVSSTWATAFLLEEHPGSSLQELSREKLADHLGASNLKGELAFFHAAAESINPIPFSGQRGLFERPYGFAWLLKLHSELYTWPDSAARKWAVNVTPLANWMADSLGAYLAALPVPDRDGDQTNTALSMLLALDYAVTTGNAPLLDQINANARRFYLADKACKTESEASAGRAGRAGRRDREKGKEAGRTDQKADTGFNDLSASPPTPPRRRRSGPGEVVSPCLTEAALMSRVLSPSAFRGWLTDFLPPLESGRFSPLTEAAGGTDSVPSRERARLSALSFQRAQALERIAHALPGTDPRVAVLHRLSAIHGARGFELMNNDVSAMSWLPAYALLYVEARKGS
jgi:hypothetical protein